MKRFWIAGFLAVSMFGLSKLPDDAADLAIFESHIKAGNFAVAQAELESYTAQHKDSWRAQYQLGYVYFRLHRIQSSVERLCKSLLINPDFAEAHKILAYGLNIAGHPDRAIIELERAIKLEPASAESHYELGRLRYEAGEYMQAVAELEKARAFNPESVRVHHNLGLAYAAVAEKGKAVDSFEEGLRRNRLQAKPSAWPLIDYATYFNLEGEYEKARATITEAIAMDNSWDQAFEVLSKAYRGLGRFQECITALERAASLNPSKPEYHYALAQLYRQTRQYAAAEDQLARYRQAKAGQQKQ